MEKPIKTDGMEQEDLGSVEDIEEEEYVDAMPDVSIIPDADLLILPTTVDTIDDAIEAGGSVTVLRRWTKAQIAKLIKDKDIDKAKGEVLIETMNKVQAGDEKKNMPKELADAAGIKAKGKFALVYEIWTKLKIEGEYVLCRVYYGGEDHVLSVKRCPYWCDLVPVISAPAERVANVVKGRSQIADVLDIQIFANDQINEGADTAHFSAMPIIMTDPEKNPRVGSMVLGLASIWETNPRDTQFAQFPELWKSAFERVSECKNQIFQSLGVNPAMMPNQTGSRQKRNQAEIANEQQVDILTTADAVTILEEGILTPLIQRFAEYDHQFRDKAITVRQFGEIGIKAVMQDVEPIQMNRRFEFRWFGVEAARNAAQVQQQISMANVFKEVPPSLYQGHRLDLTHLMVQLAENAFGPRLAPLTFVSLKDDLEVPVELENQLLMSGMEVPTHPGDKDPEHLQAHMQLLQQAGDDHGVIRAHILAHQTQMQMKVQAQAQAMQGGPPQGGGGGGPQAGSQPQPGRNMKGPNGSINPDRMPAAGAVGMPRKT